MDSHPPFPAASLSRTAGARLQASSTPESHPLGSSPPPPSDVAVHAQKYKPYTPRTRVVPATTTTTLVHPPSPTPVAGEDATSKLQLTKARSEAQNLGLETSSIGWAILDKIVVEGETGGLWAEIWASITTGKVCALFGPSLDIELRQYLDHHLVADRASVGSRQAYAGISEGSYCLLRE
jgi:hypothetical protein